MKTIAKTYLLLAALAGVLSATSALTAGFPNADDRFSRDQATGYVDEFKGIGNVDRNGYTDQYKLIGGAHQGLTEQEMGQ